MIIYIFFFLNEAIVLHLTSQKDIDYYNIRAVALLIVFGYYVLILLVINKRQEDNIKEDLKPNFLKKSSY